MRKRGGEERRGEERSKVTGKKRRRSDSSFLGVWPSPSSAVDVTGVRNLFSSLRPEPDMSHSDWWLEKKKPFASRTTSTLSPVTNILTLCRTTYMSTNNFVRDCARLR